MEECDFGVVSELGLVGESVRLLSGKQLRVSVVTDSGKVRPMINLDINICSNTYKTTSLESNSAY